MAVKKKISGKKKGAANVPSSAPTPSWMTRGAAGAEKAKGLMKERKRAAENAQPYRIWVAADGKPRPLIFLDSDGVYLREHVVETDAKNRPIKYATCVGEFEDCAYCEAGDRSYYICARTVIDPTPYTDRKGVVHSYTKRLHVVKVLAMDRWNAFIRDNKGIELAVVDVVRYNQKEPNSGLPSRVRQRVTRKQLAKKCPSDVDPKQWLAPFDYVKIFAPQTSEEARKAVGQGAPIGSEDKQLETDGGSLDLDELFDDPATDEDIPF